jgi:hypothetical protein
LPRDAPTTPFRFSSSLSEVSAASALRALNACVGWWFSCLTNSRMPYPTASSSGAYLLSAVGASVPRILSRASNTSAIVKGHMAAAM